MLGGLAQRRSVELTIAIAGAAVAWEIALAVGWDVTGRDFAGVTVIGSVATGMAFIACGLYTWWRTPHPQMGVVMLIAAWLWMLEDLSTVDTTVTRALFEFTSATSAAGFALAALAYPTGHLRGRTDRAVVGVAAVLSFVVAPLSYITVDADRPCPACRVPPLSIDTGHDLDYVIGHLQNWVGLVALIGTAVLLAHRWFSGTRPERRMTAPFLGAGLIIGLVNLEKVYNPNSAILGNLRPLSNALVPLAFFAGLARLRLVRVGITPIVREIDQAPSLSHLRDVLRRTLGDKRIAIRTWDQAGLRWRDEEGCVVVPATATARVAVTAIDSRDGTRRLGELLHDPALAFDPDLLQAVTGAVRLSLQNNQLHDEVTEQLARVADAADGERRRVARDLHDGAQQRLVGLMLDVSALRARLTPDVDEQVAELLDSISAGAANSLKDLRRLVQGLSPPTLVEEGLGNAVRDMTMDVPIDVVVEDRLSTRMPATIESAAFLMISEALANVTKHSGAHAARVRLQHSDDTLAIAVSDDGIGGADPHDGSGIRGLHDRAATLGGTVTVTSPAGRGTTVGIRIPVAQHGAGLGMSPEPVRRLAE